MNYPNKLEIHLVTNLDLREKIYPKIRKQVNELEFKS